MAAEEYLSSELQRLLEGFTKIQDVHLALQTYCELQDERMSMEQERSEKLKVNLEKIYEAYLLLQTRYKSSIEEFDKERNELRGTIEELREQCEHLRSINILEDHNGVSRLQDEVEVLKIRLEMQDHQHREDIALLKQQHSDEIKRYKMLLNATEVIKYC
ncbi:uncharacterized protein LOC108631180 [Ceratina calcarata]|uniref:Uncharacterized protein LOC108631180 n=1 Tax=Ceratina calcarata TaxID=156304 RepID=A0AAJ7SC14_9HYME|nr:uncharacterized protein LOC108631180 [Ceratina calcarata]